MTRDIHVHGPRDDHGQGHGHSQSHSHGHGLDLTDEDDVYAALWASAPLPRLPEDAPDRLKDFAVDVNVDDPRRIYTIYRAARRHLFQILVERYIHQIRYGCSSKSCNTATCFSCRKRLAAGAPVRRYNATSARTLAIYMASQDNPEQGLCHHPNFDRPGRQGSSPSKGTGRKTKDTNTDLSTDTTIISGRRRGQSDASRIDSKSELGTGSDKENQLPNHGVRELQKEPGPNTSFSTQAFEEPTKVDHRSFVQSVLGTVAFKMVEWLTPRSLEAMSRPENGDSNSFRVDEAASSTFHLPKDVQPHPVPFDHQGRQVEASSVEKSDAPNTPALKATSPNLETGSIKPKISKPSFIDEPKPPLSADPKPIANSVTKRTSKLPRRKLSESNESQSPKGILNLPPRTTETAPGVMTLPQLPSLQPRRKLSRQTLIKSPSIHMPEMNHLSAVKSAPMKPVAVSKPEPHKIDDTGKTGRDAGSEVKDTTEQKPKKHEHPDLLLTKDISPPQSLSFLPIDLIGFLCDVLQFDGTSERHTLQPPSVSLELKQRLGDHSKTEAISRLGIGAAYPASAKEKWKLFIEQGFFDVLSEPSSLIQSFSYCDQRLYDSQTLWYIMLRLTRVSPSVVLDSLWNVAGTLFRPPKALESIYDWAKEQSKQKPPPEPLSNHEASRIINICLHALVATTPLVSDARQLANMSRIRSYGLTMLGRETSSLEPIELCLQYEDAFSNELALRLARRLFASIPTRRRFAELMELQSDVPGDEKGDPDVLESVLATLRFLESGTGPTINFPDTERDLHEKRVPTLILDWARTVMLQDWDGSAEVPADGAFSGALAMMSAMYKHRKPLVLGDIHFRTEYFAERLDPVGMPLEWLAFQTNKRTVHLLDHPYLFNPSTLVTYFRAINYSRMNQAYESAKAMTGLMHSTMSESSLMTDQNARFKLFERLRIATSKFLVLEIGRQDVLVDTFNAVWRKEERELMRPLKIRLGEDAGEEGMDSGGVQQEFFRLAIAEALDPDYGIFAIDNRTKMTWFQPGSPEPLWKFELIGIIVSLAVYNGLTLPVTFPKALYRKLLDHDVTELHHIADGWPDLANGLTSLLEWDEKDGLVEDVFARTYEFSVEHFGQHVSREMGKSTQWPQFADRPSSNPTDAPMVTNENRNGYVSDYIQWLTDISIQPQFEAFQSGFFTCIDRRSITLFDPDTFQSVVEGIQEIDISEMRRATRHIGWEASHPTVRDFWSIVKRYDMEEKRKLLEFVTASDRVPVGGMRNLQFTLQRNGVDDGHLPSSYTCYGILLLPEYSSKEILREKLAMALENSKGFGFA
ncbi:Hect, E3 ligase [Venustampulla echinocandica]|uniref:HECT-type E3 ubiquitin transferase n=1 Tax=Venustampulla echinocandica TaxID=2656787 RepID=A0A370TN99_9HELO|nr:Hect, E3 ligase [Venustampulla echinocandica]RDL36988.1 Hect, E3 ligase [Venustampulla echinocandica]